MKKIALIAVILLLAACNDEKRLQNLEDELENTSLIAYQLLDENERLKKKLKGLGSGETKTIVQTKPRDLKAELESSKRKLFVMRMKVMNFQLRNERFPENVQELKEVLGEVPVEDRTRSNVIHLARNGRGGWTYDPDEGTMSINSTNQ